ncbi:LacI family transcriptional regulator [Chromatiales bacterium (ex Bugula neritina AB1)]|nr:LacI family transcriptional regulator [Chromatiales bacterium (ex Bugula neritina AB1)]
MDRQKSQFNSCDNPNKLEASNGQISISVPMQFKRSSGRRMITFPDGTSCETRPWDTKPTSLQLALARGHHWLALLESGQASSIKAIAKKEGIDNSYVSRMINLTTLAPDIVAAILDDRLPPELTLFALAADPPRLWCEQRKKISFTPI